MDQITSWIEGLQGQIQGLGYALAIIAVLVLGIILVTGGREAMSKGKGMAVGIIAGIGVLSFGVALVSTLQG